MVLSVRADSLCRVYGGRCTMVWGFRVLELFSYSRVSCPERTSHVSVFSVW